MTNQDQTPRKHQYKNLKSDLSKAKVNTFYCNTKDYSKKLSEGQSVHKNFEYIFRNIHMLKYTTQLILSLLGFLSDSVELESLNTSLATSLTMETNGRTS